MIRKILLLAISLIAFHQTNSQLIINEIMSNNVSFVMDDYLNYSMWVEVYNPGATSENLQDYFFTNNPLQPEKWRPPFRPVAPGKHARLWFERPELAGHASFKLDPEGGALFLFKNGVCVDSVIYPSQYRNTSYGRLTDGANTWARFIEPSTAADVAITNPVTVIANNDTWNYRYETSAAPTGWNTLSFNDSGWNQNRQAPLGYGKTVNTTIGSPRNPAVQTGYFRKKINVADATKIHTCFIQAYVDDAAAFYVNGTEVFRYNLPEGELLYEHAAITGRTDFARFSFYFPSTLLNDGENVIAAEVHQQGDLSSSDFYFALTMTTNDPATTPSTNANSNNGHATITTLCAPPVFTTPAGFYNSPISVSLEQAPEGSTIRYTTDGSEPTATSTAYTGTPISVNNTTCIRAATFCNNKLNGQIVTSTFFINERNFTLPVISIASSPKFLYDSKIGIYTAGELFPENYWWDWDRPANFEIFDTTGARGLSQELDISLGGQYSQEYALKSLKISPRYKFGDHRLRYDFFSSKPGKKYKDIQIRNSGNDFDESMMRDAFMQTLIIDRLDVDYLAYQPAVIFINGVYYGLENIRERSSKDYLYTNYGLEEDEIILNDQYAIRYDTEYLDFVDYMINNDPTTQTYYDYAKSKMDVGEYMDYFITEIFINNTDWIINNFKYWRPIEGDTVWRWILYDTDYGFGLYENVNFNSLNWALNTKADDYKVATPIRKLLENPAFRRRFASRFAVHLSTTFAPARVEAILDSLSNKIAGEMVYHKQLYTGQVSFDSEISKMRDFSRSRTDIVRNHLGSFFFSGASQFDVNIDADIPDAKFTFNDETIPDPVPVTIRYFKNNEVVVKALDTDEYEFQGWVMGTLGGNSTIDIVPNESVWSYWDKSTAPPANWNAQNFDASSWNTGKSMLGYPSTVSGVNTLISYGDDSSNKYPTAYFRHNFTIADFDSIENFRVSVYFDDGVAVYVNGVEIGRENLPLGELTYNLWASDYGPKTREYSIPLNLLTLGQNTVAAEVHQHSGTSSDLLFNLSLFATDTREPHTELLAEREYILASPTADVNLKAIYNKKPTYIETISVENSKPNRKVISVETFDLLGRPIDSKAKGLILLRKTYDNNTIEVEKRYN